MKCGALAVALVLVVPAQAAQAADDLQLNPTQALGRRLVDTHCGVCHTRPTLLSGMYGPELSRETAGGNQEVVRGIVTDGTPRMPGFKHMFNAEQIAAIAAYVAVLPPGH
jgi:mono/diheme cytochrome c family protein